MIVEAGLQPEIARTDENTPLVRTAVDPRLVAIAGGLDAWRGQDGAAAVVAWPQGVAGLDARVRHPGSRSLSTWSGPARARHAFAARLGDDAGGDSPDSDRHQRVSSSAADQRPATAIAPGRERGGTTGECGRVCPVAPNLTPRQPGGQFASARAECEIVSCRRGHTARSVRHRALWAAKEVEQRHRWQTGSAVAAAMELCGDWS